MVSSSSFRHLLLVLIIADVTSFAPSAKSTTRQFKSPSTFVFAAKKNKGFGAPTSSTPKKPKATSEPTAATPAAAPAQQQQQQQQSSSSSSPAESSNAGQKALEKLRRERAEQRDAELRKVREMMQADAQLAETPAAIPEKVAQRMGKRMLPFVGLPLFLGMGTFVFFWYSATYRNLEFQPVLVAISTIVILVFGLLGITYSVMSASWDPEREGDFLGWEEFQRNLKNIQQGFTRTKENAILREKTAGLTEEELQRALDDLERREAAAAKKQQSLNKKLKQELE